MIYSSGSLREKGGNYILGLSYRPLSFVKIDNVLQQTIILIYFW